MDHLLLLKDRGHPLLLLHQVLLKADHLVDTSPTGLWIAPLSHLSDSGFALRQHLLELCPLLRQASLQRCALFLVSELTLLDVPVQLAWPGMQLEDQFLRFLLQRLVGPQEEEDGAPARTRVLLQSTHIDKELALVLLHLHNI